MERSEGRKIVKWFRLRGLSNEYNDLIILGNLYANLATYQRCYQQPPNAGGLLSGKTGEFPAYHPLVNCAASASCSMIR